VKKVKVTLGKPLWENTGGSNTTDCKMACCYVCLFVCRVLCAKVVGATSSEGFLVGSYSLSSMGSCSAVKWI